MFSTHRNLFLTAAFIIAAVICVALTYKSDLKLFACEAAILAAFITFVALSMSNSRKVRGKFFSELTDSVDVSKKNVLENLPFPAVVCSKDGTIIWCSNLFLSRVAEGRKKVSKNIEAYINGKDFFEIINSSDSAVYYNNHAYTVFSSKLQSEDENRYILYFVDYTELRMTEKKYNLSKPYVLLIETDNIGDSRFDFRDSEKAEIRSIIEKEIENWTGKFSCITKHLSDSRYIIIADKSDVEKMKESKFSILDSVRGLTYKDSLINSTLSIGVSSGNTFSECEVKAKKALEMALSRGGDQAVLAENDSYEYFGGVSKKVETKAKVQARVIGTALAELIEASDEVIVMGHRNPDLDAIGSALGICCACEAIGVPAFIVTDKTKTLCSSLIDRILDDENQSVSIIDESTAMNMLGKKTMLVVTDTHLKNYVEFPELYEAAETVFVIDHHRKSVGYIDNAVVFYHDPGASSASEMVTELLQYIKPEPKISQLVADALLSGIMLDTKNFVLGTGVRTFEAAAFLRKNNADTVNVQKLFANSIDNFRLKNKVISDSVQYKNCAVSIADIDSPDIRIISSRAADELLNIEDVKASFVIYKSQGKVCISARSYGERNVQIVMESMGGGGHKTMAAVQLDNTSPEATRIALFYKIDEIYEDKEK